MTTAAVTLLHDYKELNVMNADTPSFFDAIARKGLTLDCDAGQVMALARLHMPSSMTAGTPIFECIRPTIPDWKLSPYLIAIGLISARFSRLQYGKDGGSI